MKKEITFKKNYRIIFLKFLCPVYYIRMVCVEFLNFPILRNIHIRKFWETASNISSVVEFQG